MLKKSTRRICFENAQFLLRLFRSLKIFKILFLPLAAYPSIFLHRRRHDHVLAVPCSPGLEKPRRLVRT